jgi:hypothetical protein
VPTLRDVRVVGRTVVITAEARGCGACTAAFRDYTVTATFTAPSGAAPFVVEYQTVNCTGQMAWWASETVSLAGTCAFDSSLVIAPSSLRVTQTTTLRWCNPTSSTPDNAFTVNFYRIYRSKSLNGPFEKLRDVQGASSTSTQFTAGQTAADIGTNYFFVEAHGCTTTITGECVPTTVLTQVASAKIAALTGCAASATTLCLGNGRFAVTARWRTADGTNGDARPVQLTPDSGYFWFFNEENVELTVKALKNGCSLGTGRYWLFAAGMTNVAVELTVIDFKLPFLNIPSETKTYSNPAGRPFVTVLDTDAFLCL